MRLETLLLLQTTALVGLFPFVAALTSLSIGAHNVAHHTYSQGLGENHVSSSTAVQESRTRTEAALAASGGPWVERAKELLAFSKLHGHCIVPKRYLENKSLANWVNKQRQEYRRYISGEKPCSLTKERIDILNEMGFCWDASSATSRKQQMQSTMPSLSLDFSEQVEKEEAWWATYEELQSYMAEHQISHVHDVPTKSKLDDWVKSARSEWAADQQDAQQGARSGASSSPSRQSKGSIAADAASKRLNRKQIIAMTKLDRYWHLTARQATWEKRFLELLEYRQQYGDCCVPISYEPNKKLANWVSTQRKQFNLRQRGLKSGLTDERFQRLQSIGFIWNRWEHEFNVKQQQGP